MSSWGYVVNIATLWSLYLIVLTNYDMLMLVKQKWLY